MWTLLQEVYKVSKKEKLKQIKEAQQKFLEQEEAARPLNPNYRKGRRTNSQIFAGVTVHNRKSLADY